MFNYDDMMATLPMLRRRAKWLSGEQDAEDLVQETISRAIEKRDLFRDGSNLPGWLYFMMRNIHFMAIRARRRVGEIPEEWDTIGPDNQEDVIVANRVVAAVDKLSPERSVALIRSTLGDSYEDIAVSQGVAVGTIKSRVSRAREQIAGAL